MLIQTIIANALDLAGGEMIRGKLDSNFALLAALNVLDAMMLELANSTKQIYGYKQALTLAAGTDTGILSVSGASLDRKFIRYRENAFASWQILPVVESVEALTEKHAGREKAICFQAAASDLNQRTYFLSWRPHAALEVEIWASRKPAPITDLNAAPQIPAEFALLAAYRLADFTLNNLLLIDDKKYGSFVIAQKITLKGERERLEYFWRVYRSQPSSPTKIKAYDAGDDREYLDDFAKAAAAAESLSPEWNSVEW